MSGKWTDSYSKFADLNSDSDGEDGPAMAPSSSGGGGSKAKDAKAVTRFDTGDLGELVPTNEYDFESDQKYLEFNVSWR